MNMLILLIYLLSAISITEGQLVTGWGDADGCTVTEKKDRDFQCKDEDFTIQKYTAMEMKINELEVYEGHPIQFLCKSFSQYSYCGVDKLDENKKNLGGPSALCLKNRKCTKENPRTMERKDARGLTVDTHQRNYDVFQCKFDGIATKEMAGNWQCKMHAYSTVEDNYNCCRYATAGFLVKVRNAPVGGVGNTLMRGLYPLCENYHRDDDCEGDPNHYVTDGPNILDKSIDFTTLGHKKQITCKSNFKWGYCGLRKVDKDGNIQDRVIFLYCSKRNRACNTKADVSNEIMFNFTAKSDHEDNRCTFEATAVKAMEGHWACVIGAMSEKEINVEDCCRVAYYIFRLAILENEEYRPARSPPTPPTFKSRQIRPKNNHYCEEEKYNARNPICWGTPYFGIVEGPTPGDKTHQPIKVKEGEKLKISCKATEPWSYCEIAHYGYPINRVDCKQDYCPEDALKVSTAEKGMGRNAPKYRLANETCSLEKIATAADSSSHWTCKFYVLNIVYQQSHECCLATILDFEVTVTK